MLFQNLTSSIDTVGIVPDLCNAVPSLLLDLGGWKDLLEDKTGYIESKEQRGIGCL